MNMTIEEFCRKHIACEEGENWAVENCQNMDEVWQKAKPEWLVWVATREGVLTDKELRLFAVWCARQVQHLVRDDRSIAMIDVAERYANGNATIEELKAARAAAGEARRAAREEVRESWETSHEARVVARAEAWASVVADAAAWAGTRMATYCAESAADAAAWAADSEAELRAAQAEYLRQNCKPNFET